MFSMNLTYWEGDPINCCSLIQLQFFSTAADPPLTSWPKYYMQTLHSFFVIYYFILHFLCFYFVCPIKGYLTSVCHHSLVGRVCACGAGDPGSVPRWAVLFIIRSIMAVKAIKYSFFCKLLHSFILCGNSRYPVLHHKMFVTIVCRWIWYSEWLFVRGTI